MPPPHPARAGATIESAGEIGCTSPGAPRAQAMSTSQVGSRRKQIMTNGLNRVTLFGNLGSDPEVRTTSDGLKILSFRLATNEVYFDKERNKQEKTEWHNIVLFGTRAEPLARYLTKGARVLVEGRIQTSSYEKEGVKRFRTEVVASDVCFGQARPMSPQSRPPSSLSSSEVEDSVPF
jgi:single-strand DNA-binding protein